MLYTHILGDLTGLNEQDAWVLLVDDTSVFDPTMTHVDQLTTELPGYARAPVTLAVVDDPTAGTQTVYVVEGASIDRPGLDLGAWVVALDGPFDDEMRLVSFHPDTSATDPYVIGALTGIAQVRNTVTAADIAYAPDTPGDWDGPPGTVRAALDEIAARMRAEET